MSESTLQWIKGELIPQVVSTNRSDTFQDVDVINCEVRAMEGNKDNWASTMFAVTVNLCNTNTQNCSSLELLIKIMDQSELVRKQMHSEKQFSNEIHLYSVVLPYFMGLKTKANLKDFVMKMVPKCYYTSLQKLVEGNPRLDDGVIVMEDLRNKNYKLGNRTYLDLKHCTIGMENIGEFHALSYFSKECDQKNFHEVIVQPIQETNYATGNKKMVRTILLTSQKRVLDALENASNSGKCRTPEADAGVERLRAVAARDPFEVFIELATPKEPLAVLCHGDFLRNNVLFRYEGDVPVDMKLIDFQTVRYASPAIDVSLFLCMNTSRELRATHFMHLLHVYHESMRRTLATLLGQPEDQLPARYDFDNFLEDFRKHALYGYFVSIEFIPWMMANEEDLAEYVQLFREEMFTPKFLEKAKEFGGEDTTKVIKELAEDLIIFGCL